MKTPSSFFLPHEKRQKQYFKIHLSRYLKYVQQDQDSDHWWEKQTILLSITTKFLVSNLRDSPTLKLRVFCPCSYHISPVNSRGTHLSPTGKAQNNTKSLPVSHHSFSREEYQIWTSLTVTVGQAILPKRVLNPVCNVCTNIKHLISISWEPGKNFCL